MVPFCVIESDIKPSDIIIHLRVIAEFAALEEGLTCHQVCDRIAERIPEVQPQKGRFNGFDHSWLTIKGRPKIIIDPYPWACASGPILITLEGFNPWRFMYKTEDECRESRKLNDPMLFGDT